MKKLRFKMLQNEVWWGGSSAWKRDEGRRNLVNVQPYDETMEETFDSIADGFNQSAPLYLSSKGRYVWCDSPLKATFKKGVVVIEGENVRLVEAGDCLRDAYLAAMKAHFPFEQKDLPEKFFTTAQYNTWMEFTYNPTQKSVLAYAHAIVDNGYEPGILIIDEGWSIHYGTWEFDFVKFPDPKAMLDELHALGFTVMLWLVPYVTLDGRDYLELTAPWVSKMEGKEYARKLVRQPNGQVAIARWWNGTSGVYNMCEEADRAWLDAQLQHLMRDYGVDGFKFDGGNIGSFAKERWVTEPPKETAEELNKAWNDFGARYTYHEYKDTYGRSGRAVIQRIQDKDHAWEDKGLQSLVPTAIVQGLLGYPYICPDMVGGGQWHFNLDPTFKADEELFVRMAQCSALFPMIQFSWAPWRLLGEEAQKLCLEAAKLHAKFAERIVKLVKETKTTGEPILRSMEYAYPHSGYERLTDQFLLGQDVLVAPVVVQGQRTRRVQLPNGKWRYVDGTVYEGGKEIEVDAPLEVLPYFEKV